MYLPAVYTGQISPSTEENDLNESIEVLRAELSRMQVELQTLEHDAQAAHNDLMQFTEFRNAYLELQDLIARIEKDAALRQEEERKYDPNKSPTDNLYDQYDEEDKEEVINRLRKVTQAARRLFKRISNLTHPDKTKDPDAIRIFLEAKRLCLENDIQGLEAIYHNLVHGASGNNMFKDITLQTIVDSLSMKVGQLANQLEAFHTSPAAVVLHVYNSDTNKARCSLQLRTILRRTINQMMAHHYPNEEKTVSSYSI